jgi:RNA polymerase sigma factor (TIGR02999 family)
MGAHVICGRLVYTAFFAALSVVKVVEGCTSMAGSSAQVTELLKAVGSGELGATDRLVRVVYDELHRVAHALLAREARPGDLQTTVVVNEVCLRLLDGDAAILPQNRRQLFGFAAKAMRQFLVDNARKRDRLKRGGGRAPAELADEPALLDRDPAEVLALHEALEMLGALDTRLVQLVELRYYGGLSIDETAAVLGCSPRQVDKDWSFVRTWLRRELS